ncbi:hypothetical protein DFH09DRAFT_1310634 [Mycena vulgaris]|nr:hypothetical protein DFH09DRAFT_1310634 [Mycena vulgaris]
MADVSEDIFLLVFLQLAMPDVISLRQVCRRFGEATQAKFLRVHFLDVATSEENAILPAYLKTRELLSAAELEALVTRVSRLAHRWRSQDLCPVKVWRLYLPQSITWLRLISGSWLFVASSDNHVSKISCWDLSLLFQGYPEPIAEAYLPGQVRTAQLEVQDSGIVLAFGLGPISPLLFIVTLRQYDGSHYFMELCRIEGSSQVLMLHGNSVGCALRNDVIEPHIIDWRTNEIYELPPPPGPFDVLDRRSVPHLFVIWNGLIVIVRQESLELYSQPSPGAGPTYIKSLKTVEIWEVVVLDRLTPLKLLVISSSGVALLTVEPDAVFSDDAICAHFPLATTASRGLIKPWYHLSADGTALGYTVIGNCFGELAVYDCVGSDLMTGALPFLSLTPIPLGLRIAPRRPLGPTKSDPSLTHWVKDDLHLDHRFWCTDFLCDMYTDWDMWQGALGDKAWLLDHAHGFPSPPIPQAHAEDWGTDQIYVLLRSGNRYLANGYPLRSFSLGQFPAPLGIGFSEEQPCLMPTAYTDPNIFHTMWYQEYRGNGGQNRWIEQQERGGRPHENLVDTLTAGRYGYGYGYG